jgi:hypothetical protein
VKEALKELDCEVVAAQAVDQRDTSRVERGGATRELRKTVLEQTAGDFAVVIGVARVDDEPLHLEDDEHHRQRCDKRHASNDQHVSRNVSAVLFDVRTHEFAFLAMTIHESRKLSRTVTECARRAGITLSINGT